MWEVEYDLFHQLVWWLPLASFFAALEIWIGWKIFQTTWGVLMDGEPPLIWRNAPMFSKSTKVVTSPVFRAFGCLGFASCLALFPIIYFVVGTLLFSEMKFVGANILGEQRIETGYVSSVFQVDGVDQFTLNDMVFMVDPSGISIGYNQGLNANNSIRAGACIHLRHINGRIAHLERCYNCREVCTHPDD